MRSRSTAGVFTSRALAIFAAGACLTSRAPAQDQPAGEPPKPGGVQQAPPASPPAEEAPAPPRRHRGGGAQEAEPAATATETPTPGSAEGAPATPEGPVDLNNGTIRFGETLGYAGDSPFGQPHYLPRQTVALPDRWRIGWPTWDRYGRAAPTDDVFQSAGGGDSPYTLGHPLNPYDRNFLKGDYPIIGDDVFMTVTALSDTFIQWRRLPTPSGASAAQSSAFDFFGDGRQFFLNQTALISLDLFKGYSAFRPVDWLVRVSGGYNVNYLNVKENNITDVDPGAGDERTDSHFFLQEAFFEYHLGDISPNFDFAAIRAGRQLFVSDFRGFIFNDVSDGVRLFGNFLSNRIQYNVAFFNQVEKDTNSELNELEWRPQQVLIANMYVQDFIWKGYTSQWSVHWNHDQADTKFDENGFLVRPDLAGSVTPHHIDSVYLGWTGDGHIGRLNVNHAMYGVLGHDDANPLAGREVDIAAYFGAIELSIDVDWLRPKVSFLYASGDDDPDDGNAGGFDGILDNPSFAGGSSSFYQSQALRLLGVNLTSARSFFNDLAASKAEGQSNYVNPGTILANAGVDAEITPKIRASLNANSIWMANPATVELLLNQPGINEHLGYEGNISVQYRPLLNNNIIMTAGGSVFFPGDGFKDIYEDDTTLWQTFFAVTLTY